MKHIKSINEYFYQDKRQFAKWVTKSIITMFNKAGGFKDAEYFSTVLGRISRDGSSSFTITDTLSVENIARILKPFKKSCLEKDNIVLSYETVELPQGNIVKLYYKTLHVHRVKPYRFVYHRTPEANVDSILKNGLNLQDSVNWTTRSNYLEYPPSIFAANVSTHNQASFYADENYATLKIDTAAIDNRWFSDLNMVDMPADMYNSKYIRSDQMRYIMTFKAIPASAITLINDYE